MYRTAVIAACIAAGLFLTACGGEARGDAGSTPPLDGKQQYEDVDDLIADLSGRGLECDDVERRDAIPVSAVCSIDDQQVVVVLYFSGQARDKEVESTRDLQARLGLVDCWVVGRGAGAWAVNVGPGDVCVDVADALGGNVRSSEGA
jgi:hypothetical protein